MLPLRLHQPLPPQPYALEVSNQVREGMVLTSIWQGLWWLAEGRAAVQAAAEYTGQASDGGGSWA